MSIEEQIAQQISCQIATLKVLAMTYPNRTIEDIIYTLEAQLTYHTDKIIQERKELYGH